jgi:hypothetical protein
MSSEAQDQLSIQGARTSVRLEHFQKIGEKAGQPAMVSPPVRRPHAR